MSKAKKKPALGRPSIKKSCKPVYTQAGLKRLPASIAKRMANKRRCTYRLRRPFKAARFVNKHRPDVFAIVHRSTKKKDLCQISFFDAEGPYGDREHKTCSAAIADMSGLEWKLAEVT